MMAVLSLVPSAPSTPAEPVDRPSWWMPKGMRKQTAGVPLWRRTLVRRVWEAREAFFALDARGDVATYVNKTREVRALSKRSTLFPIVVALLDELASSRPDVIHVVCFDDRARGPVIVRLVREAET